MSNYARNLARDSGNAPMTGFPSPVKANTIYQTENNAASSAISLNPNTAQIEVGAYGGQGVVIRWVARTETASVAPRASVVASGLGLANFDHWIPAGTVRQFVVPRETAGVGMGGQTGSVHGLYQRVAVINGGAIASSMLLTEY